MQPTYRKPIGVLAIILGIIIYGGLVARLAGPIGGLPGWTQPIIYLVLGILWIAPLKPLLLWMETGRWFR